jgi:hypothetical protein
MMPLSNAQYQDVLRHFLMWVRRKDPVGFETLMRYAEIDVERGLNRETLLRAIKTYAHTMQPATTGTHGKVLRMLNAHISGDIRGVQVMLSPQEQQLYRREVIDLTPIVDKSEFVAALHELYGMIAEEGGHGNDRRGLEG